MFTGIVEELGSIRSVRRGQHSSVLSIAAKDILSDLKIGDSVAVNGVCLTATTVDGSGFTADVMHETLNRSSLGSLTVGSHVNLERAMAANGRFGGHIVSGHIDGTGTITALRKDDNAVWYTISASQELLRYIVENPSNSFIILCSHSSSCLCGRRCLSGEISVLSTRTSVRILIRRGYHFEHYQLPWTD